MKLIRLRNNGFQVKITPRQRIEIPRAFKRNLTHHQQICSDSRHSRIEKNVDQWSLAFMKMNQQIFSGNTQSMFRHNSEEIDIFLPSLLFGNANSNPDLNWNNAEKEDDVQNNNKKMEKKDCKMASRISLLTHPRQQREFSSSTGRLSARHRSPACPPSRPSPTPSHPGRCLANRSRPAIGPILIYPHRRRRADHPARWRKCLIYFNFPIADSTQYAGDTYLIRTAVV